MGRSTVHYADNQTNNILKALHNKLRPAGTPVQRVEYILELLLLRMFEVKLKRENEFKDLRVLFNEENANQDKLFSYLLTLGSDQILPTLNKDFFPFYAEILKHARKVLAKNINDTVIDQLVLIQEVFANSNFTNNVQSGNLHDVIALIEELDEACLLNSDLLGDAIESALSETGGTKDIGLFRTPDHIRHFMVGLVEPGISDTVIDPACGTGGFLFNAHEYVLERIQAPYRQDDDEPLFPGRKSHPDLQNWFKHYFAKHPYPMPSEEQTHHFYRSGIYGIEYLGMIRKMAAVNFYVRHLNPANLQQGDSLDLFSAAQHASKTLVLANPPFGAERDKAAYANVWEDYPKESETTILFVKMMLDYLAVGGRCAVVVSEGFLTWEQGSAKALRKMLLQENKLQAVIGLPQGVFVSKGGQGPKTSILLIEKGTPTQQVWFYNIDNDGYSKGTNRTAIADCQLVEALNLYHDYVKQGKIPPETRRSFSLSVDWLNVVDPRTKAKIRAEVREKMTVKQEEAREKLLKRLDKKRETAKTAKPGSPAALFDDAAYQMELNQFAQTWEHKIQTEIAQAINKAHLYSFNSANYRSTLADNQLSDWDELVQHHQPDSNGHSLDQRYAALQKSPLQDAITHIAHFDPKNAIEADIVREYLAAIAPDKLAEHPELIGLDGIFKSGAKYLRSKLENLISVKTEKIKKDDYQADVDIIEKISFADGKIHFRDERQTGMDLYKAMKGDLVTSKINVHQGAVAIAPCDLVCSTHYQVYEINQNKILPNYLIAILRSHKFIENIASDRNKGIKNEQGAEFLYNLEIPLPPLEIQKQIAEQIERQQAIITGVENIIKNWEIDDLLDFDGIIYNFSQVTEINTPIVKNLDVYKDSLYVGGENIASGKGTLKDLKSVEANGIIGPCYLFQAGQIVYSKVRPNLRKCFYAEFDGLCSSDIYPITANQDIVLPKYLAMLLVSEYFARQTKQFQERAGMPKINRDQLAVLELKIPSKEQQEQLIQKYEIQKSFLEKLSNTSMECKAIITQIINSIWASS